MQLGGQLFNECVKVMKSKNTGTTARKSETILLAEEATQTNTGQWKSTRDEEELTAPLIC